MRKRALLIDGHNYLFKGFYGVPVQAKRGDGAPVNAVYGFFALLRRMIAQVDPEYLLICFDAEGSSSEKREMVPEYKANRISQPETIFEQLKLIKKCLNVMDISWVEHRGIEADDLIGTCSTRLSKRNIEVYIGSEDHDFMQLVSEQVFVTRSRHGEVSVFGEKEVISQFGVKPNQYTDYIALVGDPTDNIKGVNGIGKKRAVDLLSTHGTIEGLLRAKNLGPSLDKLLAKKKAFLLEQRAFLEIEKSRGFPGVLRKKDLLFQKEKLSGQMGKFLDRNWNKLN